MAPEMKWTERHVQVALAHWFFDWRRQLIIPNISHGFFAGRRGECDLLMVSKAGYLTEIEIKVNPYDLIGELRKFKHENRTLDSPFGPLIKRYYIAAPEEVWQKANGAELPLGAGKIEVYIDHQRTPRGRLTQPSAYNKAARCLTDKEMIELLRLAYFRLWNSRDMEIFESHQRSATILP